MGKRYRSKVANKVGRQRYSNPEIDVLRKVLVQMIADHASYFDGLTRELASRVGMVMVIQEVCTDKLGISPEQVQELVKAKMDELEARKKEQAEKDKAAAAAKKLEQDQEQAEAEKRLYDSMTAEEQLRYNEDKAAQETREALDLEMELHNKAIDDASQENSQA